MTAPSNHHDEHCRVRLVSRCKHLIEPKLRARTQPGQHGGVALAIQVLSNMIRDAKPVFVRS